MVVHSGVGVHIYDFFLFVADFAVCHPICSRSQLAMAVSSVVVRGLQQRPTTPVTGESDRVGSFTT